MGYGRRFVCTDATTAQKEAEIAASKSKSALLHSLSGRTDTEIVSLVASGQVVPESPEVSTDTLG